MSSSWNSSSDSSCNVLPLLGETEGGRSGTCSSAAKFVRQSRYNRDNQLGGGRKTTGTDGLLDWWKHACLNHGRSVNTSASSFMVSQDQHHTHQGGVGGRLPARAHCYIIKSDNVNSSLQEPMKSSLGESSLSLSPPPLALSQHHSYRADWILH